MDFKDSQDNDIILLRVQICQSWHKTMCFQPMKALQTRRITGGGYNNDFY